MKPRRHFLSRRLARKYTARFGLVCTLATTIVVRGADILRGGTAAHATQPTTSSTNTPAPIAANASGSPTDTLARNAQAIQAVQAMQTAARTLAKGGSSNLGQNPNNPSQTLPDVPDGLGTGGLKVDSRVTNTPALWQGANLPVQSTTSGGSVQVTVTQTAQQAILNWETFNIGKNTTLTFDQSAGGSNVGQWIAFNKVNDPTANPTQILGTITAPGQVYIINRNGIIFGGSSQVNTHALVASALPINDVLIQRGLLNNPDNQFLFDALDKGSSDDIEPTTKFGNVTVQAGAQITAPTSDAHVGGRVMLVGANVTNNGTISTPDGQTILAAGLQVGVTAHDTADASLRGLDVSIGAVVDPASLLTAYAGTATNSGIISSPRANITMAGKAVNQLGIISSTTSVSFNGRIDLLADYDAIGNAAYSTTVANGPEFLNRSTGTITLGEGSATSVLPELDSTEKVVGTSLALGSQVNLSGQYIHFADDSLLVAPSGAVNVSAGVWNTQALGSSQAPIYFFMHTGGQIDLDAGAVIDVSGSKNVASSVTSNIVAVELRGTELADSPLNRDGALRGQTIYVDITQTGIYNGKTWVGTPLADVSGYVNLVQRTVGELTTAGGTVNLNAGGSVVLRQGASVDVSGGWVNYAGGVVQTSRLTKDGKIIDISAATPDVQYDGVYGGTTTEYHSKWGVGLTFTNPIPINGSRYQEGFTAGGNGGTLNITAPSMALDGSLKGSIHIGERQTALLPLNSTLNLAFTEDRVLTSGVRQALQYSPTPPLVTFSSNPSQEAVGDYATDGSGTPLGLPTSRVSTVVLNTDVLSADGFGSLSITNPEGNIVVPESVTLSAGRGGSITLAGANIDVEGSLSAAGGTLSFTTYNVSPGLLDERNAAGDLTLPPPGINRGLFTLGAHSTLSTAGLIVDDRPGSPTALQTPLVTKGGTIAINTFSADLTQGSIIDVSGGVRLAPNGKATYGNGGSITINTGRDTKVKGVTGGTLELGSELRGYSGAKGGSLSLQTLTMQIGGSSSNPQTFVVDAAFFNQGGFSTFGLSGIGTASTVGMLVSSDAVVNPQVTSAIVSSTPAGQPVTLQHFLQPEGLRSPVSLSFSSLGVKDLQDAVVVRAETVVQAGAKVDAGPSGSISINGTTIDMNGSLRAAGGTIQVNGASLISEDNGGTTPSVTVILGSTAVLDTSGTTLLIPDEFGRRRGQVLDGGTINVSGNIVAESGAVLNVSGTSGILDLLPGESGRSLAELASTSGTTSSPYATRGTATTVASDGGTLNLKGGELLLTDATLLGNAGGSTAAGGTLTISSNIRSGTGTGNTSFDAEIFVTNSGTVIPDAWTPVTGHLAPLDSSGVNGGARFSADDFARGGFANLDFGSPVKFSGAVTINAPGRISVGTSTTAAVYADGNVQLHASYIVLGTGLGLPLTPDQKAAASFANGTSTSHLAPTYGTGSFNVSADLIDVGYLSMQGIGSASLTAQNGDIRGNGTLAIAGDLHLTAAQIYPPTQLDFTIAAYDYTVNSTLHRGSVTIDGSGTKHLPLSAGGNLSIYASTIQQNGVLRAPFGTIRLGWDGTGTAPAADLLTGQTYSATANLTLGSTSVTSVSAIDPITGKGVVIPYGTSLDGTTWLDPSGVDITSGGVPQKSIKLSGTSVTTMAGSQVDIRGGGDLMAYRWVNGLGGSTDILGSTGSFAVVPGYDSNFAPDGLFGSSTALSGLTGYSNSSLQVGDQVRLDGGGGLPAGVYTLLPARYALLPGAYLVTPKSGGAIGAVAQADGSRIVSGTRLNSMQSAGVPVIETRFEVASAAVIAARAAYTQLQANTFLTTTGGLRLPGDAGQLVFAATQAMAIGGQVFSTAGTGFRGGLIDISSPVDIVISSSGAPATPGALTLDASLISNFGAESLLIGGYRQTTADGTLVTVATGNLTVDNAGSPLTGQEIILVGKNSVTLADGASIQQTGTAPAGDNLILGDSATAGSGNGALIRIGGTNALSVVRRGVTVGTGVTLKVGAGAKLKGTGVVLDSTSNTQVDSTATLDAGSLSLSSGHVSLLLDPSVTPGPDAGLVLAGSTLATLSNAGAFALSSYSSLDLLGAGTVGTVDSNGKPRIDSLTLRAAEIRGMQNAGGSVDFYAKSITLDNLPGGTAATTTLANSGSLSFHGTTIALGTGSMTVKGFTNVNLAATSSLQTTATGTFHTTGNLAVNTPLVYAAKSTTYGITADGTLAVTGDGSSTGTVAAAGLGAALTLTGTSVNLGSRIVLPSGDVYVHATTGDVNVTSSIEAGGISRRFKDVTQYTDGGRIRLTADHGNVTLGSGGTLDVSAKPGAGNGGELDVSAVQGTVSLLGTANGAGGTGGSGGTFVMDTGTAASLGNLDTFLNSASFSASRSFRVRNGDVLIDGIAHASDYLVSADNGSIQLTGTIDASGATGGSVRLAASDNVTLASGAVIDVSGSDFDSAGKGGDVTLETRGNHSGQVAIQAGSKIDLTVDSWTSSSAAAGKFQGTLHLRAPRNSANTDLAVAPIDGQIVNASNILVEGYKTWDVIDYGGIITSSVQADILASGQSFLGSAGTTTSNYTAIFNRLLANNHGLDSKLVLAPGAEIVNSATVSNVNLSLNATGSGVVIPSSGGSVLFPTGTVGTNKITSTAAGTVTSATGVVTTLAASTPTVISAGSTVTLATGGTLSFASGTGGAIPVTLVTGSTYNTTATNSVATISTRGTLVTLNTAGASGSSIALTAGSKVAMPTGTVGTNRIRASVGGTITSATGTTTTLVANTSTAVAAGSTVTLNTAGTLTFFTGTGGALPIVLASGSFTTSGTTTITPNTGNLMLGSTISTITDDWNLATNRFGALSAPGVLTLRSAGNIVLYNTINDGFNTSAYTSALLARNPLLPDNIQSWSYRITAGADLSAADTLAVQSLSALGANAGSLLIGKNAFAATVTGGTSATTASLLALTTSSNPFQVIRTGSGDIDVAAGRDIRFLNQFATIYTAGTLAADQTLGGTFVTPNTTIGSFVGSLGVVQQSTPAAVQFTDAGGNIALYAGNDIIHLTQNALGQLIDDSEREMPINWLYRRGFVDPATGMFGIAQNGDIASTAWWVDFTNFFEGVGALGGGNVSLTAGRDVKNVDAAVATNARMPSGTPDPSKLVELGGGDLAVRAGRNIDGGVYYVEKGHGTLHAVASITTNSTRSPSLGILSTPAAVLDPSTWLGTTLFVGKSTFDVSAGGDLLLGPVANAFLLPQGYNNSFWYKSWFSTYGSDSGVSVESLGGSVKLREGIVSSATSGLTPALQVWFDKELVLRSGSTQTASLVQPWLRLTENLVANYSSGFSLMPGNLSVTTYSGDISLIGNITLSPSATGNLQLLSAGAINGLQVAGTNASGSFWSSSRINVSDTDPTAIPGVSNPFAYQSVVGTAISAATTGSGVFANIDALFNETGSSDGSVQKKQTLHAKGVLHSGDTQPVRLYSEGNISGFTLYAPKSTRILAGQDLRDVGLYIQNTSSNDVSVVSSGRDLIAYDANSPLRVASRTTGNLLIPGQAVNSGDIQVSGPGTLEVFAGRNLDLGTGNSNSDGTGTGITSIGNGRNPYLPFGGAGVVVGAGIGNAWSLDASKADFTAFISQFVTANEGPKLLTELGLTTDQFNALDSEKQDQVALQIFYLVLRNAGRNHNNPDDGGYGNYDRGTAAIATLFPGDTWSGNISTEGRSVRTSSGGDISIFAPGGSLTLASTAIGNPQTPPGIVTESGGNIDVFTRNDVNLGISRIFTLRGGDEIIWSSLGNIAAGSSSKTVQSAPPTRVLIDPQSADVKIDLAGLATGGGIGVLTSVAGVKPGDVDLIAPVGTVDAGDAGIRVSGNLNIAAAVVLNASNISVGGSSAGAPSVSGAGVSLGSLAPAASNAATNNTGVTDPSSRPTDSQTAVGDLPSIFSVEVLGYGGADDDSTDDDKDKEKKTDKASDG